MQHSTPKINPALTTSKLKKGWTTGACATAAAKAAYLSLITGQEVAKVSITLPRGQEVEFELDTVKIIDQNSASASVIKDAGDDPDVTHGARIISTVVLTDHPGVQFNAGVGIGTVTRPGLKLAVGEPAINPIPRQMLASAIDEVANLHNQPGNVEIIISIPDGEALAKRTLNGRLGIVGGLSILGTTGIVKPYSCSAWIDSIHRGVDVARACQIEHVAACTGSTSEKAVQDYLGLADVAMVEMGDFVGAILKYMRKNPVPNLTIGGGFAKVSKLAMGHINLHSKESIVDFDWLADQAKMIGAKDAVSQAIRQANSALETLVICRQAEVDLATHVASLAQIVVKEKLDNDMSVSIIIVDSKGQIVGQAIA